MSKLSVCVGSSCHLKGSYSVINALKDLIKRYQVEDSVELCASFCLGKCSDGVSMKIDDEFVLGANAENIEELFVSSILPRLK